MTSLLTLVVAAVLTGLDQWFKMLVETRLKPIGTYLLIPGVLQFRYTENTGAMMGMLPGKTVLMAVLAVVMLIVMLIVIFSKKVTSKVLYCALVCVFSGGLGNIIDRIFRGFVIDYIEVLFVKFYIFNFADCLITVGAFAILIYELVLMIRDQKRKKAENG